MEKMHDDPSNTMIYYDITDTKEGETFVKFRKALINWPGLSNGGKVFLAQALEHKEGVWKSNAQYYLNRGMRGKAYVNRVLMELEKRGFLARLKIRNIGTKKLIGCTIWLFTDYIGGLEKAFQKAQETLAKEGKEIVGTPYGKIDFSFYTEGYKRLKKEDDKMLSTIYLEAIEYKKSISEKPKYRFSEYRKLRTSEITNFGQSYTNQTITLTRPNIKQDHKENKDTINSIVTGEPVTLDYDIQEIFSYWNQLPNVRVHKIDPKSKTIQSGSTMISNLLAGLPVSTNGNGISPTKELQQYAKRYNITKTILNKKWSIDELKQSMKVFSGFDHKTKIGLPDFLWNPYVGGNGKKGFSHLLIQQLANTINAEYKTLSKKLAKAIGIKLSAIQVVEWSNAFRYHIETEGSDINEIKQTVNWYIQHAKDTYTPKVYNPESFFNKKIQIENARNRIIEQTKPREENNITQDPEEILKQEFPNHPKSDKPISNKPTLDYMHMRDTLNEAVAYIGDKSKKAALAVRLIDMHKNIKQQKEAYKNNGHTIDYTFARSSTFIISYYIDWLDKQAWLTSKSISLFDVKHKNFQNFLDQYSRNENNGRSMITGADTDITPIKHRCYDSVHVAM